MELDQYERIYGSLNSVRDVPTLSQRYGVSEELLTAVLTQKIVRDTKRRYYDVKRISLGLLDKWCSGMSFMEIAGDLNFPPVLTASIILHQKGVSPSQFRKFVKDVESVEGSRLKEELREALKNDIVYSPEGNMMQASRGRMVEEEVKKWLESKQIGFMREAESRKHHPKTPDFLLEKKLTINDREYNWIECKASFGDKIEVKKDHKKQFQHYVELFGSGIVIYWYGFTEENPSEDVQLESQTLINRTG